ncbi:hypothetical protein ACFQ3Y_09040 [Paenibacillus motobuensis]|uniref:hypothetical protein n=1 Tax=Paenibacillus motobuensis TaxID=295324 RepID=UPI003634FC9A
MRLGKARLNTVNTVTIGDQSVELKKVTIAQWRELFAVTETLPQLILGVLGSSPDERATYFMLALESSLEEIVRVVSVLTGIDEEYIENNASITELVDYFTQVAKVNDFQGLLKNVRGVLSLSKTVTGPVAQDASVQ